LLKSCAEGAMDLSLASLSDQHCVGVVLATSDYPRTSTPLQGLNPDVALGEGVQAFWGGSTLEHGTVRSSGGRVLTVSALGDDLAAARARAYDAVRALADRTGTKDLTYRTDIAKF
ncbi:MAG TPA: phosphoribosylglycinamide synthetase C domain-containing protein, partial [Alphaproteobacteria bacterium]|nr:phosphoribosylglycinamide synthetase C domain-containing protein [Alphaproteobacteria bacterium]